MKNIYRFASAALICLAAMSCDKTPSPAGDEAPTSDARIKEILLKFYDATSGPSWDEQPNWAEDSTIPLPMWDGVDFVPYGDGEEAVGIELTFCNNSIKGEIPPEIFNINNMTSLLLYGNELSGPIPDNIGQAKSLAKLRLDDNAITGNIPQSLSQLKYLRDFSADGNMMSGTVPSEVVAMPYFYTFSLDQSEGYSLDYPALVEDLQEKAIFKSVYDKLPEKVRKLYPWDGESPLPETGFADLDGQGHIVSLCLNGTEYGSGTPSSFAVPEELTELVHLKYLMLGSMGISALPENFDRLTCLEYLDLYGNIFESFPEPLTRMPNLRHLLLLQNKITSVPDAVEGMSDLKTLDMYGNNLTGHISANLRKLPLTYLDMSPNDDAEEMPQRELSDFLNGFPYMRFLFLENIGLSGKLPESLPSLMPELVQMELEKNNITGNVPASYAGIPHLLELRLRDNRMSGVIPQEIVDSPYFEDWCLDPQQEGYGLTLPSAEGSGTSAVAAYGRESVRKNAAGVTRSAGELKADYLRRIAEECGGAKFLDRK